MIEGIQNPTLPNTSSNTRLIELGFWAAVLFVLVGSASQMIFGLVIQVLQLIIHINYLDLALLAALVANCFSLLLFYIFLVIGKYHVRDAFQLNSFKLSLVIPLIFAGLTLQILGSEIDNLFRMVFPPAALDNLLRQIHPRLAVFEMLMQTMEQMLSIESGITLIITILSACIVGPAFEELLFRGVIFTGLRRKFSLGAALVFQSFLFGLMHANPWQFLYAFILGIFLGLIASWSRSIFPAIILHIVINSSAFILNHFFPVKGLASEEQIQHVDPLLLLCCFLVASISIFWLYYTRQVTENKAV
ncbi:CPBP family intramembrane metalloprotease [candidate division KSB1 bacterium]|nr:CPBP family intramembrane metalloprotease [candidate division KSB1 bacterium]